MREKRTVGINPGSASLVMIIAVLALAVFSVLTLMTSVNEKRLTEKAAGTLRGYYAADLECERLLASVKKHVEETGSAAGAEALLPEDAARTEGDGREYLAFSVPMGDLGQRLAVVLAVAGGRVETLEWSVVNGADWDPGEYIDVWDGK